MFFQFSALNHNDIGPVLTVENEQQILICYPFGEVFECKSNDLKHYKTLLRPDTFSPTEIWQYLLNEYIRLYPDLGPIFDEHHLPYELDLPSEKLLVIDEVSCFILRSERNMIFAPTAIPLRHLDPDREFESGLVGDLSAVVGFG